MLRVLLFASFIAFPLFSSSNETVTEVVARKGNLHCVAMGEGEPLLIIHGGPGLSMDYLRPSLDALAKDHFVIFYDQRGCGKSEGEVSKDTINPESFNEDILAILRAYGFKKASLLGHSWGGFVAMNFALEHPESVDKLIFANSFLFSESELADFHAEVQRRLTPFANELQAIQGSNEFQQGAPELVESYYRLIFKTYLFDAQDIDKINCSLPQKAAISGARVAGLFADYLEKNPVNLYPKLKALETPTLVIHGDADPVPLSSAHRVANTLPDAQLLVIENCGHFPYVETPAPFFEAIAAFLKP